MSSAGQGAGLAVWMAGAIGCFAFKLGLLATWLPSVVMLLLGLLIFTICNE